MGVYRFTFEMVLDVRGDTPEDALDKAHAVLVGEIPALVEWEELGEDSTHEGADWVELDA